jgi:hypothetical protein
MFIDNTDRTQSLEPGEDEEDVDAEVRFQSISADENRPQPPPVETGTGAIVNELLIKPGKYAAGAGAYAAGAVMNEVRALGTDVQSDIHDIRSHPRDGDFPQMDMFAKTASALFNSVVIYAIADIRMLIRQHRDQMIGDANMIQQFMDLPITDVNVMVIILANVSLLQEMMKKGAIDFYISAVYKYRSELKREAEKKLEELSVREQQQQQSPPNVGGNRRRRRSIYDSLPRQQQPQEQPRASITLEVFNDENSSKELVYGISVNR